MNVVWLKKDLRLIDHEPLFESQKQSGKTLLLYIFEPELKNDPHYSKRHFDFIKQSLEELQLELSKLHTQILIVEGNALAIFKKLHSIHSIKNVFSHQETGINTTYQRDIQLHNWFKSENIVWNEYVWNGVFRGRKNRESWKNDWYQYMESNLFPAPTNSRVFIKYSEIEQIENSFQIPNLKTNTLTLFQKGGVKTGLRYLHTFLNERVQNYSKYISKPELGQKVAVDFRLILLGAIYRFVKSIIWLGKKDKKENLKNKLIILLHDYDGKHILFKNLKWNQKWNFKPLTRHLEI